MARSILIQRKQYQKNAIGRFYWNRRDQAIFKYLQGQKIIDLGCGEGVTLEKILKLFPSVKIIGIDNDLEKIKICRQHHLPVKLADITHLPFKNNSFDCALLIEVIEHLTEKQVTLALKEIHRILRPAGRLVVLFPNDRNFKIIRLLFLKFKEAFHDYCHLKQWQPQDTARFKKAGFSVIYQESLPFHFWPLSLHHLIVLIKSSPGL